MKGRRTRSRAAFGKRLQRRHALLKVVDEVEEWSRAQARVAEALGLEAGHAG